ncbi:MAG: hypothetical protein R3C15_19005 [Thermoleophilia bacterium]
MSEEHEEILAALEERIEGGHVDDEAEVLVVLASLAGEAVELDEDEAHAAGRRALLLLATGGDPLRGLELDGRAVTAFAEDVDAPGARASLAIGLTELAAAAGPHPRVTAALLPLLEDDELAWRCFAAATLAQQLLGDED